VTQSPAVCCTSVRRGTVWLIHKLHLQLCNRHCYLTLISRFGWRYSTVDTYLTKWVQYKKGMPLPSPPTWASITDDRLSLTSSIHERVRDEQGTENDHFVSFESPHYWEYSIRFSGSSESESFNRAPSFDHRKSATQLLLEPHKIVSFVLFLDTTF
jgi:hypothetical protein